MIEIVGSVSENVTPVRHLISRTAFAFLINHGNAVVFEQIANLVSLLKVERFSVKVPSFQQVFDLLVGQDDFLVGIDFFLALKINKDGTTGIKFDDLIPRDDNELAAVDHVKIELLAKVGHVVLH